MTDPQSKVHNRLTQETTAARPNPAQILERLKRQLPAILQEQPVCLAYVHSSVAAGCPTPLNDSTA